MRFGILGSGSWATALAKVLTDNGHPLSWYVRSAAVQEHLLKRKHNPHYLPSVDFSTQPISIHTTIEPVIEQSEVIVIAVPSAYLIDTLSVLTPAVLAGKKILSAVKGILPEKNLLLNEYLQQQFQFPASEYFTLMGPCHAEEIAAQKLSYLTFSGLKAATTEQIAACFANPYVNTITNDDIMGVQYAAVLKNIYALGAGIAHGLDYGDNFLSVFIANCADEMAAFLHAVGIRHMEVGLHDGTVPVGRKKSPNYAASVYLGDLLVTCYSLYSRNRTFGTMIGKGYSVKAAQLELSMVAEGYLASRCIVQINQKVGAAMPIATSIYQILWEQLSPKKAFQQIEESLV